MSKEQKDMLSKMVDNKIFARGYIFLIVITLIVISLFTSLYIPLTGVEITTAHAKVIEGVVSSLSLAVTFLIIALVSKEAIDIINKFKK